MGKSKKKTKRKTAKDVLEVKMDDSGPSTDNHKKPDESFIDKLFKKADTLVETFDYDLAKQFYQRILEYDPTNLKALESLASVHLDLAEMEEAEQLLLRAISLSPDTGHRKYFSLAQLKTSKEALDLYLKGVAVIHGQMNGSAWADSLFKQEDSRESIKSDLSNAYCAMTEIYMTDCCYEENAENECKSCIEKAIETDELNPEAFQCLANYQLLKEEIEGARKSMEKSLSLWLPKHREARESVNQVESEMCPLSYDSRVNTSKLLIELEMFDEAAEILDGLIEEDDEETNTWYMLGVLNHLRGKDYYGNASFYLKKALKVDKKKGESCEEIILHINELLAEIGPVSDEESDKENLEEGSDDEYETMSEEELETS